MDNRDEETLRNLVNFKGKYIKATLQKLEQTLGGSLPTSMRKIILDGFNDYHREVLRTLGYVVEDQL